ncbi:MAG: diacylglycerol kinase, partial [Acidimicrobiia bacterium]|nr:diacylglycerol kinase [Acidimicrobiia bacterium]
MTATARERAAALVALASVAGAVVLVGIAAVSNWRGLLLTLAGVLAVVVAGWYAVSRRGATRTIALLAALAGVALFVAGFVIANLSLVRVIAVVVLGGLSVAAARVALGRSPRALHARTRSRTTVPPGRHPVLIMNPKSGGGKAERFGLVDECHVRGIEPIVLRPGDDLLRLAEDAISRGADV